MISIAATQILLASSGLGGPAVPIFVDRAVERGVAYVVTRGPWPQGGCGFAACDLDGDGDEDLFVTGAQTQRVGVFRNDGNGVFADVSATSGVGVLNNAASVLAFDYDGDGDLDLLVGLWALPAQLLRNDGELHFTNVTAGAGLAAANPYTTGCSAGDFDGDGDLDIATGVWGTGPAGHPFYRNNGDGTFTDVAQALGVLTTVRGYHALLADLDRDGDADLYRSIDVGGNQFYRNLGQGVFASQSGNGATLNFESMGAVVADLDGDARMDIYCTNIGYQVCFSSPGGVSYSNIAQPLGVSGLSAFNAWGWCPVAFDAENDADDDLFVGVTDATRSSFWTATPGSPFVESAIASGLSIGGSTYTAASADLDGDGDVDLVAQRYQGNLVLAFNETPAVGSALRLKVVGRGANTHAVGALVDVETDITAGGRTIIREVTAGGTYKTTGSYIVHAGLGAAQSADRVTVRWPRLAADGGAWITRVLTNVPSGFVLPVYPPERLGDVDGDGRVRAAELAALDACVDVAFGASCALFDFDGDCDVDAADHALAARRMADLDGDGAVGVRDFAILLNAWGRGAEFDLTGDRAVDGRDLAVLLGVW